MAIFSFSDSESLGKVAAVDTSTATVSVVNVELLRKLQVNRLVVLQSSRPGQHLVGVVQKIIRNSQQSRELNGDDGSSDDLVLENNVVRITLIGTFIDRVGMQDNVFRRTLETVPEIEALCFAVEGENLTQFMRAVSYLQADGERLSIGHYTLDEHAEAFLNANRFFQRHAVIVGSTGSGKSWTTARLLERIAVLPNACAILFDIHGEYHTLSGKGVRHFRIAGPSDIAAASDDDASIMYFPYWLLGYEDLTSLLIDYSDQNAPNQAMVLSRTINARKRAYLEENGHTDVLAAFTIDSPVPFSLSDILSELHDLNTEMVPGAKAGTEKQGEYYGRLSRLLARMENKINDRRLGFLFTAPEATYHFSWLEEFSRSLLCGTRDQPDGVGGVKIIDFSEVPSDILPLVAGRLASLIFSVQQWTAKSNRHPIALFCDEAHLYIPNRSDPGSVSAAALPYFERIAKEGRKYGVGLVVISQRPSEVSRTVLSQCNNFVALRLTNAEDQQVIQRLLPDTLGGFTDVLPVLDTGEALVVGDASLLPSRIRIAKPDSQPDSGTIDFWDRWCDDKEVQAVAPAVHAWRCQSTTRAKSKGGVAIPKKKAKSSKK
jgi:hypothetical protein